MLQNSAHRKCLNPAKLSTSASQRQTTTGAAQDCFHITDSSVSRDSSSNMDWFTDTVNSYISLSPRKQPSHSKSDRVLLRLEGETRSDSSGQGKAKTRPGSLPRGITGGSWWGTFYINNARALRVIDYKHKVAPFFNFETSQTSFTTALKTSDPFGVLSTSLHTTDLHSKTGGRFISLGQVREGDMNQNLLLAWQLHRK